MQSGRESRRGGRGVERETGRASTRLRGPFLNLLEIIRTCLEINCLYSVFYLTRSYSITLFIFYSSNTQLKVNAPGPEVIRDSPPKLVWWMGHSRVPRHRAGMREIPGICLRRESSIVRPSFGPESQSFRCLEKSSERVPTRSHVTSPPGGWDGFWLKQYNYGMIVCYRNMILAYLLVIISRKYTFLISMFWWWQSQAVALDILRRRDMPLTKIDSNHIEFKPSSILSKHRISQSNNLKIRAGCSSTHRGTGSGHSPALIGRAPQHPWIHALPGFFCFAP